MSYTSYEIQVLYRKKQLLIQGKTTARPYMRSLKKLHIKYLNTMFKRKGQVNKYTIYKFTTILPVESHTKKCKMHKQTSVTHTNVPNGLKPLGCFPILGRVNISSRDWLTITSSFSSGGYNTQVHTERCRNSHNHVFVCRLLYNHFLQCRVWRCNWILIWSWWQRRTQPYPNLPPTSQEQKQVH